MILCGYDGMNSNLSMAPLELKMVYLALDQLTQTQHAHLADLLKGEGFDLTTADVFALLRQHQLATKTMADAIKGPHYILPGASEEKTTPPVPKVN